MSLKPKATHIASTGAGFLALLLCMAYALSFFGEYGWIFDVFSHFVFQYFLAAFFLFSALLLSGRWIFALCALVLLLTSGFELRWNVTDTRHEATEPALTVVQYNKLGSNGHYEEIREWLRAHADRFDLVVLHEATGRTVREMQALQESYPYRVPSGNRPLWNDVYVLSKHPLSNEESLSIAGDTNKGTHFLLHAPNLHAPVEVFTIHAETPLNVQDFNERNTQIRSTAQAAAQSDSPYRLMIGDWNITPFSPHFTNALEISGLNYWHRGLAPVATWPTFVPIPALQIPIDHILFGDGLRPVSKERGPAMGSDHYPLVMTFVKSRG